MRESASPNALGLILASASPRRVELLQSAGIRFVQRPACIDESAQSGEPPDRYVLRLAEEKARAAWRPGFRALGADTVVAQGRQLLGKPLDNGHAGRMLRSLSGRSHRVLTGVAVFDGETCATRCVETRVRFRTLCESEIKAYVATGEPLDKAGAYGIQGGAAAFVEALEGSYTNVVGLPLETVAELLR